MDEPRDFLSGLIVGGLLGAALAILFAPEAGVETRDRLRRRSEEWGALAREQADRMADRMRATAGDMAQRVRGRTDELVTRARGAAEDALERGRSNLEEKSDRLRRAYEEGRDSTIGWPEGGAGAAERPQP